MYAICQFPEFSNREDFLVTIQLFDDDTGEAIDLDRVKTATGLAYIGNAWTVTDGAIVTASATQITIPAFPIGNQMSALALTVGLGLAIAAGDPITIADTATGLNTMTGYVTSYNAQTGALIVQIGFTYQFEIRKPPPHWQPGIGYVAFYDFGTAPGTPILSASLANGEITVIDLGTLQVRIPESIFRKLHGGTYAVCMTMTDSYDTRQVFLGALPVLHGGVTN